MHATQLVKSIGGLSYQKRLEYLYLPTLKYRILSGEKIFFV
jgi:hypothetical protein